MVDPDPDRPDDAARSTASSSRASTSSRASSSSGASATSAPTSTTSSGSTSTSFYVIAQDGNLKNRLVETKTLLIPPAARYEVLVRGAKPGRYRLRRERFNTGPRGDAIRRSSWRPSCREGPRGARTPSRCRRASPPVPDLRSAPIAGEAHHRLRRRRQQTNPTTQFTINGQVLRSQPHRYDRAARGRRGVDDPEHGATSCTCSTSIRPTSRSSRSTASRSRSPATRTR